MKLMNYYVCLLDCDCDGVAYNRADIIVRKPGEGPPGVGWAGFTPPEGLSGNPQLMHVADNETGDLVFRYAITETKMGFVIKARIGLPQAVVLIEPPGSIAKDAPPEPESKPVLRFGGAGLAVTSGRSVVRWGRCRPTPKPAEKYDPWRWATKDDGTDLLKGGMG